MAKKSARIRYRKTSGTDRPNKDGAVRHARERAEERTGLLLSKTAQTAVIKQILRKDGKRLNQQQDGREIWAVQFEGEKIFPVFDRLNKVIVTILPADHELAARHYAEAAVSGADPRLAALKQVAEEVGLEKAVPGSALVVFGALARHMPTGLSGEVLEADMARRTLIIRAGETGRLEDRIACFDGPALKPV